MRQACLRALCAILVGTIAVAAASAQNQPPNHPPIEAYGTLPAIQTVRLSPDGKHMLALQTYHGRTAVVIYEVGAPPGTTPAILIDEMHYIKTARWAKNDRIIVTIYESTFYDYADRRPMPFSRAFSVDLKAGNPVMLLRDSVSAGRNYSSAAISDLWLDDPTQIIMPLWAEHVHTLSRDLYRVNVTTGKSEPMLDGKPVIKGRESTVYWVTDGHGKAVARIDQSIEPLTDHLKLLKDGDWTEVATYDAEADQGADIAGLSTDGNLLVRYDLSEQSGTTSIVGYEIATGKTVPLFKNEKYDALGLMVNDWTRRVMGASYIDDIEKVQWFDPSMQALQRGLENAFPGQNVVVESMTQDLSKVTVRVSSTSQPPTYYMLDRTTHRAGRVGVSYPGIRPEDMGTVKPYAYKARDGLDVPAYLTLPPGKTPKNLPVVIFPHGGPEARDSLEFNWWAQFMANRGYAVLQPNFRGSYGFGYQFRKAGFRQWGLKMQDDITDGVNKLIADGIADPKRICIVGASYGGYAALVGATTTPDLYACVVSVAGISDLPKFLTTEEYDSGAHSKTMSYLHSRVGEETAPLRATSPASHADQVRVPVLLMHGESDWTVRIDQSVAMDKALKAAGKKVRFVRFPGNEDHYLESTETRVLMLKELEQFLKENIGN